MNKIHYLISLVFISNIISSMSQEISIEMTDFKKAAEIEDKLNQDLVIAINFDNSYKAKELIEHGANVNHVF